MEMTRPYQIDRFLKTGCQGISWHMYRGVFFRACFVVPAAKEVGHSRSGTFLWIKKLPHWMNCKKIPDASIFGRDPSVHSTDLVPGPRHCNCHCTGYDAFPVGYIIISYLFLFNIFYWLTFEQKRHFPREGWFPVQHVWEGLFQRPSRIILGWKF